MHQWYKEATDETQPLLRRGRQLGHIRIGTRPSGNISNASTIAHQWHHDEAVLLPGLLREQLPDAACDLQQTEQWVSNILQGRFPSDCLPERDSHPRFVLSSCSEEAHDQQAIEKMYFDDQLAADDDEQPWCKVAWLSFHDDDASLRFRFSFGMEGFEDVAARPTMQASAADLCSALFPESRLITDHAQLNAWLGTILADQPAYVERIVYFNAPDGGAQMHHDVERGHAGVVYAQLSGHTFWLTASKPVLVQEIMRFCRQHENLATALFDDVESRRAFTQLVSDQQAVATLLDEDDHELLEALMDRHPPFIGHMVAAGHAHVLAPGDVLLLPQRDLAHCVWHTVFCLGDIMGEALSFAVRAAA